MIAGVAIDSWKLAIFKRVLDEDGFAYTEHPGPTPGTLFLKVEMDSVAQLQPTVIRAQKECGN